MIEAERAAIAQICREMVVTVTHLGDHRRADEATALFAADATWIRAGVPYAGLQEIRASYDRASATQIVRHMIGGSSVVVHDAEHASSVTYYLAFVEEPLGQELPLPLTGAFSMGEWHDTFTRANGGWRFSSRSTSRMFQRLAVPASGHGDASSAAPSDNEANEVCSC